MASTALSKRHFRRGAVVKIVKKKRRNASIGSSRLAGNLLTASLPAVGGGVGAGILALQAAKKFGWNTTAVAAGALGLGVLGTALAPKGAGQNLASAVAGAGACLTAIDLMQQPSKPTPAQQPQQKSAGQPQQVAHRQAAVTLEDLQDAVRAALAEHQTQLAAAVTPTNGEAARNAYVAPPPIRPVSPSGYVAPPPAAGGGYSPAPSYSPSPSYSPPAPPYGGYPPASPYGGYPPPSPYGGGYPQAPGYLPPYDPYGGYPSYGGYPPPYYGPASGDPLYNIFGSLGSALFGDFRNAEAVTHEVHHDGEARNADGFEAWRMGEHEHDGRNAEAVEHEVMHDEHRNADDVTHEAWHQAAA